MTRATTVRTWDGRKPLPPIPEQPKAFSTKNTRRWCRGKVGREHTGEWRDHMTLRGFNNTPEMRALFGVDFSQFEVLVCQACGKHTKIRKKALPVEATIHGLPSKSAPRGLA